MGNFLRGLLFGLGLGFLVAPMRGQDMRRLLTDRFQELRGYIPEKTQLNQYTQQISDKATQTASTLKDYAQQATAQVKDTASNLGDLAQQATAQVKDTATNLGGIAQQAGSSTKDTAGSLGTIAQQAGSDVKSTVSNVAQQATAKVQDTANTVANVAQQTTAKVQDTASTVAQQATAQVKDTANNVANAAQQASSNVKDAASNLVDTTQKTASNVKDKSKDAINSVAQTATQAQQNVQSQTTAPVTSSTTTRSTTTTTPVADSLSTIPGIEPEIQSKLEANGIHTTHDLLAQTGTKEERGDLSQKAAVSTHMLKTLADRADLMRLQGVSSDVAVMLEEAGVNGCKDLRRRNPEHLFTTLTEAQRSGDIATRTVPGIDQITQWVAEAMAVTSSQE